MEQRDVLDRLSYVRSLGAIIGTDEAGRGPLAGPVVGAAVFLTSDQEAELLALGLKDSKKMCPTKRERIFAAMVELGVKWRVQAAGVGCIARNNILRASLWAMAQSVMKLKVEPACVIVDGTFCLPDIPFDQWALVKADVFVPSVSAASVVAKVTRDRAMTALDRLYPEYGFARHKGYPTAEHREAVRRYGLSPAHRVLFCRKLLSCNQLSAPTGAEADGFDYSEGQ